MQFKVLINTALDFHFFNVGAFRSMNVTENKQDLVTPKDMSFL